MDDSADDVVVPAVEFDVAGPFGERLSTLVAASLPPATATPGSYPSPLVVIAEPASDASLVVARCAAAATNRHRRIWLILTELAQVSALDRALDEAAVDVDAAVVVPGEPVNLSAAAVAGWIAVRHDAPSSALRGLRDGAGQACRFALVVAATPTSPPSAAPTGSATLRQLDVLGALQAAEQAGEATAARLLETGDDLAAVLTSLGPHAQSCADSVTADILARWADAGPGDLEAAIEELPTDHHAEEQPLTDAALAVSQVRTAVEREAAGLGSWWGRKRRLTQLQAELAHAEQQWQETYRYVGGQRVRHIVAERLRERLPDLRAAATQREHAHANVLLTEAHGRWLESALATAAGLPDFQVVQVQRSWGSASPHTRRHLLIPTSTGRIGHDPSTGVTVHRVQGLPVPIAVAVALGLPASSVAP